MWPWAATDPGGGSLPLGGLEHRWPELRHDGVGKIKDAGKIKEGRNDLPETDSHAAKIKSGSNDLLEHGNAAEKIKEGDFDLAEG